MIVDQNLPHLPLCDVVHGLWGADGTLSISTGAHNVGKTCSVPDSGPVFVAVCIETH